MMKISELKPGHVYKHGESKAIWTSEATIYHITNWIAPEIEFLVLKNAEQIRFSSDNRVLSQIFVLGVHDEFLGYIREYDDQDIFGEILPEEQ